MEIVQDQDLVHGAAERTLTEPEPQDESLKPPSRSGNFEVASAVAAATTSGTTPSTDSVEALRQFRAGLLHMVGLSELYSDAAVAGPGEQKRGWLGRSEAADDLSCASLIAKYVSLWSVLEKPENQKFAVQALVGLQMLQGQSFLASSKVFKEIEFQTSTPAALSYLMRGIGMFLTGFIAIALFILVIAMVMSAVLNADQEVALANMAARVDPQWVNVAVAAVAGMFGSVVSLLMRISEFESTRGRSQMFLKLTGATLPIVGGVFGAFVAALFCAQIVNITIGENGFSVWAFVAIGFLSGFSERFSRSFVRLAEDKLSAGDQAPQVSVAANATVSEIGSGSLGEKVAKGRKRRTGRASRTENTG